MSEVGWLLLALIIGVIWIVGAFYVILEWVYSDVRPEARRPWQRRRRPPHDDGSSP